MLSLFQPKDILDANASNSIFEIFSWALDNFDANTFANETQLILPNSRFFPDKADNEWDMANAIKNRVLDYAGLKHWPFKLVTPSEFVNAVPPQYLLDCNSRNNTPLTENSTPSDSSHESLLLSYSSAMLKKPMDFVASMSGLVSQHYLLQSGHVPPAGQESFNETAEILSVFMGFGLLMANSAYTFRGSCAKCYDPRANRNAALPENEVIYALALFCCLKNISYKEVSQPLKPYLRATLKKSIKQIQRSDSFEALYKKANSHKIKHIGEIKDQAL